VQQSSNLDLLRSTAVLAVLGGHIITYSGITGAFLSKWRPEFDELTYFAVLMFFIHTSLVLMMSLGRLEKSAGRGTAWRFYIRRVARIYPLSIIVVCVCYAFHIPRFPGDVICGGGVLEKASNLLLAQNLTRSCEVSGPLWSLPYEVQMYVLLPFIYWMGKRLRRPELLLVVGFALWYVSRKVIPDDLLRFAPWFFMGIYAYFRRVERSLPSWMFCVALLVLVSSRPLVHRYIHHYVSGWIVFGIGIAFCYALPMFRDISTSFLVRPAASIAKYSYGIYLVHAPLMWLAFVRLRVVPVPVQAGIFIVLLIIGTVTLYHLIEAPMIRFGVNLSKPRAPSPEPAQTLSPSITA
jgi:peptidoglycan/LPS O-acetylase OafA/YrhL